MHWKPQTILKEILKGIINGKTSHIHGLEDLLSVKCLYYPKQPTIQGVEFKTTDTVENKYWGKHVRSNILSKMDTRE